MSLRDDLIRILLDAGAFGEDAYESDVGGAADLILARLAETSLQGVTAPAPEGTEIVTVGQYAAAWNTATPEERQTHLERARGNAAAATRCFLEDHGSLLELVTYWRRRAEHAEDVLASVQAELRSGPAT